MGTDVKITYVNKTCNKDKPTIFVFSENNIPTFETVKHGVAWKALANIGKLSSSCFVYTQDTYVQAMWGTCNKTGVLKAAMGTRFTIEEDDTGIVLTHTGKALQPNAIELVNKVNIRGGISAQILKDGSPLMVKNVVAYGQKATFILHPKLFWGIASEISPGQGISTAVLNSDNFWVHDIEGVEESIVTLTGNAKEGYTFSAKNTI